MNVMKTSLFVTASLLLGSVCFGMGTSLDFLNSTYSVTSSPTKYRWAGIGTEGGVTFDLVVEQTNGDHTTMGGGIDPNALAPGAARILVPEGKFGVYEFSFVDPANSDAAVVLSSVALSFLDIDGGNNTNPAAEKVFIDTNSVTSGGTASLTHVGTALTDLGGNSFFTDRYESITGDIPPVTDLFALTAAQQASSIGMDLTNTSTVKVRFATNGTAGGRNFVIAGVLVPEPASAIFLLPVLASVLMLRRNRRRN